MRLPILLAYLIRAANGFGLGSYLLTYVVLVSAFGTRTLQLQNAPAQGQNFSFGLAFVLWIFVCVLALRMRSGYFVSRHGFRTGMIAGFLGRCFYFLCLTAICTTMSVPAFLASFLVGGLVFAICYTLLEGNFEVYLRRLVQRHGVDPSIFGWTLAVQSLCTIAGALVALVCLGTSVVTEQMVDQPWNWLPFAISAALSFVVALLATGLPGEIPAAERIDLRLVSAVNGPDDLPKDVKDLIVVAGRSRGLRFLVFNDDAQMVADIHATTLINSDATRSSTRRKQLEKLESLLGGLWDQPQVSPEDRANVVTAVMSLVAPTPAETAAAFRACRPFRHLTWMATFATGLFQGMSVLVPLIVIQGESTILRRWLILGLATFGPQAFGNVRQALQSREQARRSPEEAGQPDIPRLTAKVFQNSTAMALFSMAVSSIVLCAAVLAVLPSKPPAGNRAVVSLPLATAVTVFLALVCYRYSYGLFDASHRRVATSIIEDNGLDSLSEVMMSVLEWWKALGGLLVMMITAILAVVAKRSLNEPVAEAWLLVILASLAAVAAIVLRSQVFEITILKQQLPGLFPPHGLTDAEEA